MIGIICIRYLLLCTLALLSSYPDVGTWLKISCIVNQTFLCEFASSIRKKARFLKKKKKMCYDSLVGYI